MAEQPIIYSQITSSITARVSSQPQICAALELLGLKPTLIAQKLSISPAAYSQWSHGKSSIPELRQQELTELFDHCLEVAVMALGKFAVQRRSPTEETAFQLFQARVHRAQQIRDTL